MKRIMSQWGKLRRVIESRLWLVDSSGEIVAELDEFERALASLVEKQAHRSRRRVNNADVGSWLNKYYAHWNGCPPDMNTPALYKAAHILVKENVTFDEYIADCGGRLSLAEYVRWRKRHGSQKSRHREQCGDQDGCVLEI